MLSEENVSLDCPYCGKAIYKPLGWFKKTYSTCPACEGGLSARQFADAVAEIEQAFDEVVDEMVQGDKKGCGCKCRGEKIEGRR